MLGGKTVNGNPVIFPHEESVPYHVYHQVLNAKHYGVPQNRERIFIIGIRDDADNEFKFPKPFHLEKRLKDVLETEVDEKYFLSDKMVNHLIKHPRSQDFINEQTDSVACITANYAKQSSDLQYLETKIGAIRGRNPQNPLSRVSGLPTEQMLEINENGTSNALTTVQKDNVVITEQKIRRLTPKECMKLMDFNEDFIEKTINSKLISDSQLFRQAGNSIVVSCLVEIIKKLKL